MTPRAFRRERTLELAAYAVVALGAVLRLARYLANRSLWADEGSLAANLIGRSLAGLAAPLDLDQAAPLGFLVLEKAVTLLLGEGERALRLLPLLSGLAALVLFHGLLRELMERREALVATALFALSEPLIFYASEFKPYASDVLVALLVTRAGIGFVRHGASARRAAGLALAGAIGVWLSLPAAYVCGGMGLALGGIAWRSGGLRAAAPVVGIAAFWAGSFAAHYQLFLADLPAAAILAEAWQRYFPPSLAQPLDAAAWYGRTFLSFWNDPAGLPARAVAAGLFGLGFVRWLRRDAGTVALLLVPVGLALLGAALHLAPFPTSSVYGPSDRYYPFFGRLILFSVPLTLPFVARGLAVLLDAGWHGIAGWVAIALLIPVPAGWALRNLLDPPRIHEPRPVMAAVAARFQPDDRVFSQQYAAGVVAYYAHRFELGSLAGELALEEPGQAPALLAQVVPLPAGRRFWVVTLHHRHWQSERERDAITRVLERLAERVETLEEDRAEATLWRRRAPTP